MSKLKQYLADRPDITHLYVSGAGGWLLYPRPGYEKKTRAELLGESKTKPAAEPTDAAQPETETPKKQSNLKK